MVLLLGLCDCAVDGANADADAYLLSDVDYQWLLPLFSSLLLPLPLLSAHTDKNFSALFFGK